MPEDLLERRHLISRPSGLSPAKLNLLEQRTRRALAETARNFYRPEIERASRDDELPLTSYQQEALEQLRSNPQAGQSPIVRCFRLTGPLQQAALTQSLGGLSQRHEVLRTTFSFANGRPEQIVSTVPVLPVSLVDLEAIPELARDRIALRIVTQQIQRTYDLLNEPLWKVVLLRLSATEHILLLAIDHIIADDWSMDLLVRDAWSMYIAFSSGTASTLVELSIQFADFACWQQRLLRSDGSKALVSYWDQQLAGVGVWPEIHLPFEQSVAPGERGPAINRYFRLSEDLSGAIGDLVRSQGVTMFMLLLAAIVTLLHKYTGQEDFGIPSHVAKRHRPETKDIVGWLASMLVFRINLSGVSTFADVLLRVRNVVLDAYDHQDLPYSEFRGHHETWHTAITYPCFRFSMALNADGLPKPDETPILSGLSAELLEVSVAQVEGPMVPGIEIIANAGDGGLGLLVLYEQGRYEAVDIDRFLENFCAVLKVVALHPEQQVATLPVCLR